MDKQEKDPNKDILAAKVIFLQEMIAEKTEQFSSMLEALKRFEGHSTGSKDIVEKFTNYVKKQQADILELANQQKLNPEICNFIKTILEGTRTYVRLICGDVEKVYFSKQGELLFLQQEIEKLAQQKLALEAQMNKLEDNAKKQEEEEVKLEQPASSVETATERKKKKRIRPDLDPTTRVGRAAMDLTDRRRKNQKKSP